MFGEPCKETEDNNLSEKFLSEIEINFGSSFFALNFEFKLKSTSQQKISRTFFWL